MEDGAPALVIVSLLAASACASVEDVGEAHAALAFGSASDNAAVVAVTDAGRGGFCSGTLVGSQSVLTMRFCVTADGSADGMLSPVTGVAVGSGSDVPDATAGVTAIVETGTVAMGEVVILQLDAPLPGTPLLLSDVAPAVDDEVTILGFGQTEDGTGTGVRREGTAVVTDVPMSEDYFSAAGPAFHCQGDAGGPVIDASGRLVGVGYFGSGLCGSGVASFRRVDDLLTFVADNVTGTTDAGVSDGSVPDATAPDTGVAGDGGGGDAATVDSGTMETDGGGCDCDVASRRPTPAPFIAIALIALAIRRRCR